jgi:osmotically-inducible protein OsmY
MFGGDATSDKTLMKSVTRRLQRTGSQSRVTAAVQGGTVTLTGKLQYENQRIPIMKVVRGVSGVRNVIDQLQSPPKISPHSPQQGGKWGQS